jgi:hypothetical protein
MTTRSPRTQTSNVSSANENSAIGRSLNGLSWKSPILEKSIFINIGFFLITISIICLDLRSQRGFFSFNLLLSIRETIVDRRCS